MSATLAQLAGFLREANLHFQEVPERNFILTGFRTRTYRNPNGDDGVRLVVELAEDGNFLRVLAPALYVYKSGAHREAVFQTLLQISWMTKMVQFEYDREDGEVRAIIEFPLEDSAPTRRQVERCLGTLAQLADDFDGVIRAAMDKGTTPDNDTQARVAFESMMERRRRERESKSTGLEE